MRLLATSAMCWWMAPASLGCHMPGPLRGVGGGIMVMPAAELAVAERPWRGTKPGGAAVP